MGHWTPTGIEPTDYDDDDDDEFRYQFEAQVQHCDKEGIPYGTDLSANRVAWFHIQFISLFYFQFHSYLF